MEINEFKELELEKAGSTQSIIRYPHITKKTFNFFVELKERFKKFRKLKNSFFPDDINQQYKMKICNIIQRRYISFSITTFKFYKILKTKDFNESKLVEIANLDLNTIQNNPNKLNFFECFLLRFVHVLSYQDHKDYTKKNTKLINRLIDLLNEYIKFHSYFLKLKEMVIMINNDDIDNLQTTKEKFIVLINQNFFQVLLL
ncbi:hypothetical protein HERIO_1039 [Hepatospora eriocheir]|uniref:Uncharacterized protein n=1 Tax=Hepatospora eriocheir TaxID=1081669 RepID=A0A1X0QBA2_9MICR|nr:hypothetical protein HERIO_1039 [Hepatospora eriocheir]